MYEGNRSGYFIYKAHKLKKIAERKEELRVHYENNKSKEVRKNILEEVKQMDSYLDFFKSLEAQQHLFN